MSDDDFMMDSAEEGDYDFEYDGDECDNDDMDMNEGIEDDSIEARYYRAKGFKEDDLEEAITQFKAIADDDVDGEYGFKATKQTIKCLWALQGRRPEIVATFGELVKRNRFVTKRDFEKGYSNLLALISRDQSDQNQVLLENLYRALIESFQNAILAATSQADIRAMTKWLLRVELALGKLMHQLNRPQDMKEVIFPLTDRVENELNENRGDLSLSSLLLEVYALIMQLYAQESNYERLDEVYTKAKKMEFDSVHPRIAAIIDEYGGVTLMLKRQWEAASYAFFASFKSYDESGSPRKIKLLSYYSLATMLNQESSINPFNSQESMSYKNERELEPLVGIVDAFYADDIEAFNKALGDSAKSLLKDDLFAQFIDELVFAMQSQYLVAHLKPFTRVTFDYLASELSVSVEKLEAIVTKIGHTNIKKLNGFKINDVDKLLVLSTSEQDDKWANGYSPLAEEADAANYQLPKVFYEQTKKETTSMNSAELRRDLSPQQWSEKRMAIIASAK